MERVLDRGSVIDRGRQETEPKPGKKIFVVAHGYQPPSEYFLPASNTRIDIRKEINRRIFDTVYKRLLADDPNVIDSAYISCYLTLREWIKANEPEAFEVIKDKRQRNPEGLLGDTGFHVIMPHQSEENQDTLVKIGREGIRRDFGIEPRVIWLPEAAVSSTVLRVLQRNGYEGVVLRDDQITDKTKNPMYVKTSDGKEIAIFHVDTRLGDDVSFKDGFTSNGDQFLETIGTYGMELLPFATDLENYGGYIDPGKADFLKHVSRPDVLQMHGFSTFSIAEALQDPNHLYTQVVENSSWSCSHELARWTGESRCNCEDPTAERKDEKAKLYGTMQFYGKQIDQFLDQSYPGWRNIFVPFSLDTDSLKTKEDWDAYMTKTGLAGTELGRLLQAKKAQFRGSTSCVEFYNKLGGVETIIGYSNVQEIEAAVPYIERAIWRRDFPQELMAA